MICEKLFQLVVQANSIIGMAERVHSKEPLVFLNDCIEL